MGEWAELEVCKPRKDETNCTDDMFEESGGGTQWGAMASKKKKIHGVAERLISGFAWRASRDSFLTNRQK